MKLDKLTTIIGRSVLQAKKNSPHIFFAVGVVGAIGAGVLACRATLKLEETVDEIKGDLEAVNQLENNRKSTAEKVGTSYTEHDHIGDLSFVYGKSALKLVKLYGPAIVVGGLSIFALTGSHVQLVRRNTALTVTLVGALKALDDYRERVRKEIGEDKELELYSRLPELEETSGANTHALNPPCDEMVSVYARFFDSDNPNWRESADINLMFVRAAEAHAKHMLHSRGHYFLNDAYDDLGIERTKEGSVVGWAKNGDGDGYVDFGIREVYQTNGGRAHVHTLLLDFNVDGVVYHLIGRKETQ
jgi:hypothetical protein